MTFQLNHDKARQLAKALTVRTGKEVKLKDIYEDIASIFGVRGDAMMHALKNGSSRDHTPPIDCLPNKDKFIEEFIEQVNAADYGYDRIVVAVIHLSSGDNLQNGGNHEEYKTHYDAFLEAVTPGQVDDMMLGRLADNFFVLGWPKVYPAMHMAMFIEKRFALIEKTLNDKVKSGVYRHPIEFAGAAWMAERTEKIAMRNVKSWLARCEDSAIRQVIARRQLNALPRIRFLSGD